MTGRRKYVFAHFMVGNTYPYTAHDWEQDLIDCRERARLDGFVLNVGPEEWQRDRVLDCFATAAAMHSIPSSTRSDVDRLASYMARLAHHPNMFRYPDEERVVISTFAGQDATFGCSHLDEAWGMVKRRLEAHSPGPITLIPAFFIDPNRYPTLASMDGYFHWNGGWPLHLSPTSHRREIEKPALDSDVHHLRHLEGRPYMAAVSPWFFTWNYRGDDWLYVRRWEKLLAMRDQVDIVQVISWNDYGECHYIAPVRGAQPNSQAWVDGFPHEPWMALTAYFARAFREGHHPPVEKDRIFMWARPHPKDAEARNDNVPRPDNWELTDDKFWVVVLATAPATVRLSTSVDGEDTSPTEEPKPSRSFTSRLKVTFRGRGHSNRGSSREGAVHHIQAGVTKLSHPLHPGHGMQAVMERDGDVVARCAPAEFRFEAEPEVYNFNAYVAQSE
ncbi:glycoside hydrolase family 71 protein [Schizophyllum commune]